MKGRGSCTFWVGDGTDLILKQNHRRFKDAIPPQYDPAAYLAKYPGRFISLHLSDWSAERKAVPIGTGTIDWKKYFVAAKAGGVKNYFVEMDWDLMQSSVPYLRELKA